MDLLNRWLTAGTCDRCQGYGKVPFDPAKDQAVSWRMADGRGMEGLEIELCVPCLGTGCEMSGEAKMLLAILRQVTRG